MFISAALAATEEVAHGAASSGGLIGVAGTLGLNGWLFLAQLINFAILAFALWKLLFKPLTAYMSERSARIAAGLEKEKAASQTLVDIAKERERVLSDARDEGRQLLASMKAQGDAMIDKARRDAETVLGQARDRGAKEAEQLKEEAMAEVREQAATLVVMAAEKVLRDKIDEKADRALIDRALKDLSL